MKRPAFSVGLATLLFVGLSASLFDLGCYVHGDGSFCAARSHPGHVDEYGEPDPCCLSAVPCCANPLWGRRAMKDGYEWGDPCCLEVPCPFWDVNKGADAGPDGEAPETDAGTSPEAGGGARWRRRRRSLSRKVPRRFAPAHQAFSVVLMNACRRSRACTLRRLRLEFVALVSEDARLVWRR